MKTIVLAMTELEHDKRSWRGLSMVGAFIGLTLALEATSREQAVLVKQAIGQNNDAWPLVVTMATAVVQLLATALLLKVESPQGGLHNREALAIALCAHVGAMFLQSYRAGLGQVHGSLTAGFAEPMLALVTLWLVTSLPGRPFAWLGLTLVSLGYTCATLNLPAIAGSDRTSLIQVLASVSLILRNIVIRHLVHNEEVKVQTRSSEAVTGLVAVGGCVMAAVYALALSQWLGPAFCAMTSMLLSAFLTYVTCVLVCSYNVQFVSLFQVTAMLLEGLVLVPVAWRPHLVPAVSALVVAGIGAYLFLKDWVDNEKSITGLVSHCRKPVNPHEQFTRLEFLLFSSMVIGVIFYVFQPRVSQRDLHTLSYVGLDKVIRRLLSVDEHRS